MAKIVEVVIASLASNGRGAITVGEEVTIKVAGVDDMELRIYYDGDNWRLWTNQRFVELRKTADNSAIVSWRMFGGD